MPYIFGDNSNFWIKKNLWELWQNRISLFGQPVSGQSGTHLWSEKIYNWCWTKDSTTFPRDTLQTSWWESRCLSVCKPRSSSGSWIEFPRENKRHFGQMDSHFLEIDLQSVPQDGPFRCPASWSKSWICICWGFRQRCRGREERDVWFPAAGDLDIYKVLLLLAVSVFLVGHSPDFSIKLWLLDGFRCLYGWTFSDSSV